MSFISDWCQAKKISLSSDQVERREPVLRQLSSALTPTEVPTLCLSALELPLPNDGALKKVQAALLEADKTFPQKENSVELGVFAGAVLVDLLANVEAAGEQKNLAALALVSGSAGGTLPGTRIRDFEVAGLDYLVKKAASCRQVDPPTKPSLSGSRAVRDSLKNFEDLDDNLDLLGVRPQLNALFKSLATYALSATRANQSAVSKLARLAQVRDEETNVLWWIIKRSSRDLGKPYSEIAPLAAPLVAARDLAELTVLLPGLESAEDLLAEAIRQGQTHADPLSPLDAIQAADRQWLQDHYPPHHKALGHLCPVSFAVSKTLQIEATANPVEAFRSELQPIADLKFTREELALQVYRELLTQKALNG